MEGRGWETYLWVRLNSGEIRGMGSHLGVGPNARVIRKGVLLLLLLLWLLLLWLNLVLLLSLLLLVDESRAVIGDH